MTADRIGRIVHYWPRAGAAQVNLDHADLHVGDRVRIHGHGHDFVQDVESLEINHERRPEGHPGEPVAIAVNSPVHDGDEVYRIMEDAVPEE